MGEMEKAELKRLRDEYVAATQAVEVAKLTQKHAGQKLDRAVDDNPDLAAECKISRATEVKEPKKTA